MDPELETGSTLDAATDRIGEAVFGPGAIEAPPEEVPGVTPEPPAAPTEPVAPVLLDVPKSWPKEMHEHWGTTPRAVQEYWQTREKQMLDGLEQYKTRAQFAQEFDQALTPFQQTLRHLNISPMQAVQSLLNADHRLRYSTPEQKVELAKQFLTKYGIELPALAGQPGQPSPQAHPEIEQISKRMQSLESALVAQHEAALHEARTKATKEVDVFASDTKSHPYFDEVADEIALLVSQGKSLQDAYDTAVWMNPVTRAKEQARLTSEHEAKLKETARLEALPKKRATSVNVKNGDAARTPTEPVGSLEDTIRETHRAIRARPS